MALVDYSDSESEPGSSNTGAAPQKEQTESMGEALPSLPAAFHNLYASTVRPSALDDPSLHQGRKRQIPHVVGNWPSHLYIEWHPTITEHALLTAVVDAIQTELDKLPVIPRLESLLTSDLGTPLPLHISLSRPFVLTTSEKDVFLERLTESIQHCGIAPFGVSPVALQFHHSRESGRVFLVLQVCSSSGSSGVDEEEVREGEAVDVGKNLELLDLLGRCNALVTDFGQPALYSPAPDKGNDGNETQGRASSSFHLSVAWTPVSTDLTEALHSATARVVGRDAFMRDTAKLSVWVDYVKVKIGNVVTSIPLPNIGLGTSRYS